MLELLFVAASSVCAGLPMFTFLAIIWWLDRYDREPVLLLALTFLWGAVGAIGVAVVGSVVMMAVLGEVVAGLGARLAADLATITGAMGPVVVAPLVEEPAKALVLLLVIWNRKFDNMTDGFVYGAAAGLGFAMTENFMYFTMVGADPVVWGGTVLIRTFYSAVMHATASAIVGASLGYARFRGPGALFASGGVGLALAVGVHALWNGLLTTEALVGAGGAVFGANLVLFPLEVLVTLVVFEVCVQEESATIRRELRAEAQSGTLPTHHPKIIASWTRRLRGGWLPAHVDRAHYVRVATDLAMRRKQVRQLGRRAPPHYQQDVERLRKEVRATLKG